MTGIHQILTLIDEVVWGPFMMLLLIGMAVFAFTTILTWSFYGKQCLSYFVEKVSDDVRFYKGFLRVYYLTTCRSKVWIQQVLVLPITSMTEAVNA